MKLSIIIVSYNSQEHLRHCLDSVYKNTDNIEFEVVVIDNGSKDIDLDALRNQFPKLKLIQNEQNLGFAKAVNQGIREAKGQYLLCLNPDTIVMPNSLKNLGKFMDFHPEASAAGGKVLNLDSSIQFSCRKFPSLPSALFNRKSILTRIFQNNKFSKSYLMSDFQHDEMRPVDWVSACYLIIRREAIEKIGLLDEEYFMYCEDVDWCYRAKNEGLKVYYAPIDTSIIHFIGLGGSQIHPFKTIIQRHKSIYRFYKKFYWSNYPGILSWIVVVGIIARMVILSVIRAVQLIFKPLRTRPTIPYQRF